MKAAEFDYARAASADEACRLLAGAGGEGRIIAGGQTLVPLMAMRLVRPALLVDINAVADLRGIEAGENHLNVQAATPQADALANLLLRRRLPLLTKALGFVGHVQTRNRGTIGGSLAHADPAAEICLAAATLEAELIARSAQGERIIAARDFFIGAMATALAEEECLVAVRFPVWPTAPRFGTGFQETSIRRSDFALAAAAAQLALDERGVCRRAALGLGGAATTPLVLEEAAGRLVGTTLAEDDVAAALALAEKDLAPIADLHASAEYRRRAAGAMLARALAEARAEALG